MAELSNVSPNLMFHVLAEDTARFGGVVAGMLEREIEDRPEDCSAECWRNVGPGGHECRCEEGEGGTTSAPGGW